MGKQVSPKFVLGLDVGASSVGWALLEAPDNKSRRNDPCPCGSWLKYKKCCGMN